MSVFVRSADYDVSSGVCCLCQDANVPPIGRVQEDAVHMLRYCRWPEYMRLKMGCFNTVSQLVPGITFEEFNNMFDMFAFASWEFISAIYIEITIVIFIKSIKLLNRQSRVWRTVAVTK